MSLTHLLAEQVNTGAAHAAVDQISATVDVLAQSRRGGGGLDFSKLMATMASVANVCGFVGVIAGMIMFKQMKMGAKTIGFSLAALIIAQSVGLITGQGALMLAGIFNG